MLSNEAAPGGLRLKRDLLDRLTRGVGVVPQEASPHDWLQAAALVLRERLIERWHETKRAARRQQLKQVSYLSMEFVLARDLENALLALDVLEDFRAALAEHDVDLDELLALETTPALGTGGLGRLAACFLDSAACLGLPCIGYGIRYEYGMFRQDIVDGWQVERPDTWLDRPNPWEFIRSDRSYPVRFGGRVEHRGFRAHWIETEGIVAVAHDTLVPGHGHQAVNTLRLWGAKPLEYLDLDAFNRGDYVEALAPKIRSKTVSHVLYPNDSTPEGRELRLRQEHFFVSASVQDIVARFKGEQDDWSLFPARVAVHLNDTHPALAPAELMRVLVDENGLEWEDAWGLTRQVFTYTNHTLMPEALEVWPVDLMQRLLPRHLEIVREMDRRFLAEIGTGTGADQQLAARVSSIEEDGEPRVNMGRLSVMASRKVNGVSKLHSRLVRERLFADFAGLYPNRFDNVTNGITPRRWLIQANPGLSALVDDTLGVAWRRNLEELSGLASSAEDPRFRAEMREIKLANKRRLSTYAHDRLGIAVNPAAMFDVHVKRIHEYKRQLLNLLGVIARWNAISAEPGRDWPPRTVLMAGKAASSYWMAKLIIKLAHDVGRRINDDPLTGDRLKLVFLPDYNVSLAELIIPAADLSQQISLAGTEASGTGNMKLALNGALTLGTVDGANVEIADAVGEENIFLFGLEVDGVGALKDSGYQPRALYESDSRLRQVLDQIAGGEFSPDDPSRFAPLVEKLVDGGDPFCVLADFAAYWDAQARVDDAWLEPESWTAKAVRNVAAMGWISSDRAIREYADRIWNADLLDD